MQSNTIYYLCTHTRIVKVRKHEGKDSHPIKDGGYPRGGRRRLSGKIRRASTELQFFFLNEENMAKG